MEQLQPELIPPLQAVTYQQEEEEEERQEEEQQKEEDCEAKRRGRCEREEKHNQSHLRKLSAVT